MARVGRWDQPFSSATIVLTRKRVCSPGPGLDWGPDSRKSGAAAVLGAAAARLSSAIHNYHLGRDLLHSEPDRGQTRSPTPALRSSRHCRGARPRLPVLNHSKTFERGWRIDIVVAYNRPLTSSASDSDTGGGKWTTSKINIRKTFVYFYTRHESESFN